MGEKSDLKTYTAPSGAKVEYNISGYSICWDLTKAILKSIRQGGIGPKLPSNLEGMKDLFGMDIKELGGLADIVIDIITSKEVEDLAYKCMTPATYSINGSTEKITRSTFEPEDRRGDFIFVAFEVVKENVRPFLSHLFSGLKGMSPKIATSPQ